MENRYEGLLRDYNQDVLKLLPAHHTSRWVVAYEIQKQIAHQNIHNPLVLDIACGQGDSALPILEATNSSLILLDKAKEMIDACKARFQKYTGRITYAKWDALDYLALDHPFQIIASSWFLHNLPWDEKHKLLEMIFRNLTPGGMFILMDKVYPNDIEKAKQLYNQQLYRYVNYLPQEVAEAFTKHEEKDSSADYRMNENQTYSALRKAGFRPIQLIDRVERVIVVTAMKPF